MIPPPPIRPRQHGRPNTSRLLAAYLEIHGTSGYEEMRRAMDKPGAMIVLPDGLKFAPWDGPHPRHFEPVYRPPADEFDWLNLLGAAIVIGVPAFGLVVMFRALGWL